MTQPATFYNKQLDLLKNKRGILKNKLNLSSILRLVTFILIVGCLYFLWGNLMALAPAVIVSLVGFIYLITRHSKLQYQRDLIEAQIAINETELKVLERAFYDLPDGAHYKDAAHYYSLDVDLFGRGSFYQYINRTGLEAGADVLAGLLMANDIKDIPQKQGAIKELGSMPEWRQRFTATARLVHTETPATTVVQWLLDYVPFLPSKVKLVSRIFSGISLLVFIAFFTSLISGWWVFVVFGMGLLINARFVKSINMLALQTGKIQSTFTQYAHLLREIEDYEFESEMLLKERNLVINKEMSSSAILKKFSRHLDAFDQRNNMLVGIIANGFFLRDWSIASDIENWIMAHRDQVQVWFETIAFFDAYNSLGNYAYNHPSHHYPEVTTEIKSIQIEGAAHPLLDPNVAVRNDFKIDQEQFYIITGANMAGKSTFLRTVALHIVMANAGLPVCATKASYYPTKLITSMRTTDSLTDDESYFFSELKRLKYIVDEIKEERYFIILDEILKGTNSTDKAIGSRKFVDKLVASGATGIIATHDLSLCEAANDLNAVKNYYFDARIEDDELIFDYTFKTGICQNMNASFLLKKMQIVE